MTEQTYTVSVQAADGSGRIEYKEYPLREALWLIARELTWRIDGGDIDYTAGRRAFLELEKGLANGGERCQTAYCNDIQVWME